MKRFWFKNYYNKEMFCLHILPSVSFIYFRKYWMMLNIQWITFSCGFEFLIKENKPSDLDEDLF